MTYRPRLLAVLTVCCFGAGIAAVWGDFFLWRLLKMIASGDAEFEVKF